MKVLILFSKENNVSEIYEFLKTELNEIEFILEKIPENPYKKECFIEALYECSHFLIVLTAENLKNEWFIYSLGYVQGAVKPVFWYEQDPGIKYPGYIDPVIKSSNLEDAKNFFAECLINWEIKTKTDKAKKALKEMDIAFTEYDMTICVSEGNIKALEYFMDAGFSANTKNKKGITLLGLAVRNGHRMMIPVLLKNGANVNLASEDTGNSPLMDAAAKGDDEMVSDLINAGSEINAKSKIGQTSLMLAVSIGNSKIAELLIRAGADVNIKDNLGMTAKQYATLFRRKKIIEQIDRVHT